MVVWATSHQIRFDICTMMGRKCSRLDPSGRVTSTTLHLHVQAATNCTPSPSRHYYSRLIAGTNLPTQKYEWLDDLGQILRT